MTRHDPERGDRILSFIEGFEADHGYPPSVRDIAAGVGLASTSAVQHWIDKLEGAGRIRRDWATSRSLRVVRPAPEDGVCQRPGCGKPLPRRDSGPGMQRSRWCSNSCAVKAAQVRAWLRGAGMAHLVDELGLA